MKGTAMTERSDPTASVAENIGTADSVAADLLRLALDAGNAVGWEWDVRSGRLFWFGDLQTMFGIASSTLIGRMEDFRERVSPEDRDTVSGRCPTP
jgi:PAS domain-containing protein